MRRFLRQMSITVAVMAAAVAFSACGSDSSETSATSPAASPSPTRSTPTATPAALPADEWADTVCGAFNDWASELGGIGVDLSTQSDQGMDEQIEDQITDASDTLRSATDDLVDTLSSTGAPETSDGAEIHDQVSALVEQLSTSIGRIDSEIGELRVDAPVELLQGLTNIAAEVETVLSEARTSFAAVQSLDPAGELGEAIRDTPACQGLLPASPSPTPS